ncbi:MAG: TatD family hydrolase [Candidatus Portnoybacteria bacterium]|nr:TatD family hydrolase [Candidatus Portnoybacteria bacterium]
MFIDIHAHINFKAFENDGDEVIRRALDNGVGMILVGSQNTTSKRAVEYAARYPNEPVFAAVGLHPIHLEEIRVDDQELGQAGLGFTTRAEEFDYGYYKKLAMHPKVVAIGEVGLDYWRSEKQELRSKQKEVFRKQIELALETKKALMVHCRKAHDDCIKILKEYFNAKTYRHIRTSPSARTLFPRLRRGFGGQVAPLEIEISKYRGDVHFFEGTIEQAQEYFKLGFTVSFTGVITFPPSPRLRRAGQNVTHHQELVKALPLERILLETDAPYVTPEPHRGKRNEPVYVKLVAEKVAELKHISIEEVEKVTTSTAKEVFNIKL